MLDRSKQYTIKKLKEKYSSKLEKVLFRSVIKEMFDGVPGFIFKNEDNVDIIFDDELLEGKSCTYREFVNIFNVAFPDSVTKYHPGVFSYFSGANFYIHRYWEYPDFYYDFVGLGYNSKKINNFCKKFSKKSIYIINEYKRISKMDNQSDNVDCYSIKIALGAYKFVYILIYGLLDDIEYNEESDEILLISNKKPEFWYPFKNQEKINNFKEDSYMSVYVKSQNKFGWFEDWGRDNELKF